VQNAEGHLDSLQLSHHAGRVDSSHPIHDFSLNVPGDLMLPLATAQYAM